jgi:hypothetical protein
MTKPSVLALSAAFVLIATAGTVQATTISVNITGGPTTSGCNLTDAIKAATTNAKVHGCPAGQPAPATDTIQLQTALYINYGTYLHFPAAPQDGGPVVLNGKGRFSTIIAAVDYGQPPLPPEQCSDSAVFSGGANVTIKNLALTVQSGAISGICQYAGNLTVSQASVGYVQSTNPSYTSANPAFQYGAINANAGSGQQNLTLNTVTMTYNAQNFLYAGGVTLLGPVNATISGSVFEFNTGSTIESNPAAGALWWGGGGTLSISGTTFNENSIGGIGGGALGLSCQSCSGSVTLSSDSFTNNSAGTDSCGEGAGAVYVDSSGGNFPLTVSGSYLESNFNCGGPDNLYMDSLYPNWQTYFSFYCMNYSTIGGVSPSYPQWQPFYPLSDDGTCQYNPN